MPKRLLRTWRVRTADDASVETLTEQLRIHPLTARILVARGLEDPDSANRFLHVSLDHLHDPFTMLGMEGAVVRTFEALRDGDLIRVVGDYDVDGVTSASCVYQFLGELGANVDCRIPSRNGSSHGLSVELVKEAATDGVKLLITTDCGISNIDELTFARNKGIDSIVIDHHAPQEELPPATAILNPIQAGCAFPFKKLAAVGVAFNYVLAVYRAVQRQGAFVGRKPDLHAYLDLVAMGTVADVVPLVDENRIFVKLGLEVLRRRRRPGVSVLLDRAQADEQPITARTIGYRLAPLINAAGRVGDASQCVKLLATDSYKLADEISRQLARDNTERQKREREMLGKAMSMAEAEFDAGRHLLMVSGTDWHEGVLGIVASRIKERYYRPAALVAVDEASGIARVSLRSIEGIDLIEAMSSIEGLADTYGGHAAAAGMTLRAADLETARVALENAIAAQATSMPRPTLPLDARCTLGDLKGSFGKELVALAPFGAGHAEPIFTAERLRSVRTRVVRGKHLRTRLKDEDRSYDAIGFMLGPLAPLMENPVDVAFTPRYISYRGHGRLELLIRDIKRPGSDVGEGVLFPADGADDLLDPGHD